MTKVRSNQQHVLTNTVDDVGDVVIDLGGDVDVVLLEGI